MTENANYFTFYPMLNPVDYSISKFTAFIDVETMTKIRHIAESVYFKKGASIEIRGMPVDHIFLIDEGLVQLGLKGIDEISPVATFVGLEELFKVKSLSILST